MQAITQGERTVREYVRRGHISLMEQTVTRRLRAAFYARVSSKKDEQEESYERQISYFKGYIQAHSDEYEPVDFFADEGISGLSMRKRKEFKRMIDMALDGKIDIIFVKSISRYGRSVVDILSTTRALREKGVVIRFEKESIDSSDPKCDMMLSILSTLAEAKYTILHIGILSDGAVRAVKSA